MLLQNALHTNHNILSHIIQSGDCVVDATMGNGHDTLFLANLVGSQGVVYAFDIQKQAHINTLERLESANALTQCQLHTIGHELLETVIPTNASIKAATFNLGYLPNGDKTITTHAQTTIAAIKQLLDRLLIHGVITLVVYHGHSTGKQEKVALEQFLTTLPQKQFSVATYQFLNQQNTPPQLIVIEKLR